VAVLELVLDGFMIDWGEGKPFAAHPANCARNEGDPVVRNRQVSRLPRCSRETLSRLSINFKLTEEIAHRIATRFHVAWDTT
jgi:hypothetical protein